MNVWCITLFKGLKPWSSTSLLLIIVSGYIATSLNKMRGSLWSPNEITCFLWCEVATESLAVWIFGETDECIRSAKSGLRARIFEQGSCACESQFHSLLTHQILLTKDQEGKTELHTGNQVGTFFLVSFCAAAVIVPLPVR
jgi:hypothetical protein